MATVFLVGAVLARAPARGMMIILRYALGTLAGVIIFRNVPEIKSLALDLADTLWPVIEQAIRRGVEQASRFLSFLMR